MIRAPGAMLQWDYMRDPFGVAQVLLETDRVPLGEIILDRDALSDLVQVRGLREATKLVAQCRLEIIQCLDTIYRLVVIGGEQPDPKTSRLLIDRLRCIGATSSVLQACRLLTDPQISEIRLRLFAITTTAISSCEQAKQYLQSLHNSLGELDAIAIGADDSHYDVFDYNAEHSASIFH